MVRSDSVLPLDFSESSDTNFISKGGEEVCEELDTVLAQTEIEQNLAPYEIKLPLVELNCCVITNDEKRVFAGSSEGKLASLSLEDTEQLKVIEENSGIMCLALEEQNKELYAGLANGQIKCYDIETLEVVLLIEGHEIWVTMIKIPVGSKVMFSVSYDGCVKEWDLESYEQKTIQKLKERIWAVDISADLKEVVVGTVEGSVMALSLETLEKVELVRELEEVLCVRLSGKLLAASGRGGSIHLWKQSEGSWQKWKVLVGHRSNVNGLEFLLSNRLLISNSFDKSIRLWDLHKENKVEVLNGSDRQIQVLVPEKLNNFYSLEFGSDEEAYLRKWKLGHTMLCKDLKKCIYLKEAKTLVYDNLLGNIVIWDLKNETKKKELEVDGPVRSVAVSYEGTFLFYSSKKTITKLDLETNEKLEKSSKYEVFDLAADERYVVCGVEYGFEIRSCSDLSLIKYLEKGLDIHFLAADSEMNVLFTGRVDGTIEKYDTSNKKLPRYCQAFKSNLRYLSLLKVSENDSCLVATDGSNFVLFDVSNGKIIQEYDEGHISDYLQSSLYSFSILKDAWKLWDLQSKSTRSQEKIAILEKQNAHIFAVPSPAKRITGNMFTLADYKKQFEAVVSNKTSGNLVAHNSLHFAAYHNFGNYLSKALENGVPFVEETTTPLSIALKRGFDNIIEIILEGILKRGWKDIWIIENSLVELNNSGYGKLSQLYQQLFFKVDLKRQLTCSSKTKLPYGYFSEKMQPELEDLESSYSSGTKEVPICLYGSLVKLPFVIGSRKSIEFLQSLDNCSNNFYAAKLVQGYLDYKFEKVRSILLLEGSIYLAYLVLLSIFVVSGAKDFILLNLVFVLNIILFLYEFYQMSMSLEYYWKDLVNYIDLTRSLCCSVLAIQTWAQGEVWVELLSFLVFVSLIRGIFYFRLVPGMIFIFNLLVATFKDVRSFSLLLLYSTVGFGLVFKCVYGDLEGFWGLLKASYLINLGDFDANEMGTLELVYFFLATVINPIIMLNLIISIMGDTLDRVMENRVSDNRKVMIDLILEVEYLFFWNRNKHQQKYLQVFAKEVSEEETEEWGGKVAEIKEKITQLSKEIAEFKLSSQEVKQEMKKDINQIAEKINQDSKENFKALERVVEEMDQNAQQIEQMKLGIRELVEEVKNISTIAFESLSKQQETPQDHLEL